MPTLPQRGPIPLIGRVLAKAGADDAGTHAAALTYQGLLSTVPLVLLAGAIVGFVFADDPAKADQWLEQIAQTVPGLEQVIGNSLEALVDARVQAGIIAIAALAWTGSSLAARSAHTLAVVFGLQERPWHFKRLWSLVELTVIGAAALAGIWLTALTATGAGLIPWLVAAALDLGLALLAYVALTPPGGPPWRRHIPGAIFLAVAWTVLKLAGGWYVDAVIARASAVYGTIAAIIGFLAILALASRAFVYGAELSSVLATGDGPAD